MFAPGQCALLLLAGHALADFALQPEYLARAKNRHEPVGKDIWPILLAAHSAIHAGAVALVTDSAALGVMEFYAHWWIDLAKCEGWISYRQDQALHVVCKLCWFLLWLEWPA